MTFGEILVLWYGWNKGTCAAVSEVRMRKKNNYINKSFSCHVVGCGQIYPMENFYDLLKAPVEKL